jgi:hypothetical protein
VLAVCSSQNEDMSPERNSITLRLGSRWWPYRALTLACSASSRRRSCRNSTGADSTDRLGGTNEGSSSKPPVAARRRRSSGKQV